MAIVNKKFYNDETEYSDGSVEDEILEIVKNNEDYEEIINEDLRWPVFYHLSHLRQNLFNWYPFRKDANLLEIGAGCGALTGLFCNKVSEVTSVELTKRRSQIIYNRHKDLDNLEIFPGNLNNMEFDKKFDYIILCGVLEYANKFTDTDNPYVDFLKKIKSMLSDDGVILVAIENRLGLKYFSGSREDHLRHYFIGINDYPNIDTVRTFSKYELEEVVKEAGFNNYKFFYPYPDYKFPQIIHTDELVEEMPVLSRAPNYDHTKIKLFEDGVLNSALANEGISKYFANSFLVELRNSDMFQESENFIYSKLSASRNKQFRIGTNIYEKENQIYVSKYPLNPEAEEHIKKMHNFSSHNFGKIKCLESDFENKDLIYKYLENQNVSYYLTELLKDSSNKSQVINELKKVYSQIEFESSKTDDYYSDDFVNIFGCKKIDEPLHCHEVSNLDFVLGNLFNIDNEIVAIDYEWCFDFPIPVEYVFWRALKTELLFNKIFIKYFTMEEVFEQLGFNTDWIEVFKDWEDNLSEYVGRIPKPHKRVVVMSKMIENAKNSDKKINRLNKKIKNLEKENKKLKKKVNSMESSKSWKITKPLRGLRNSF